jgi:hypothetical protein
MASVQVAIRNRRAAWKLVGWVLAVVPWVVVGELDEIPVYIPGVRRGRHVPRVAEATAWRAAYPAVGGAAYA